VHADLWFKNAVVYSLNVETFLDANGDGCGDLEGLSRKLDYLNGLGVDTLWLAPFQPTPGRDDGYDITDHLGVDPRFGTSGDFVEFMHEAGSRGIRVIVDLVVNHTSDRHPWFKDARSSRDTARHDWYVWSDKRPPDWDIGMVFPGVQQETWSYEQRVRQWYFHRFYDFEPDLNMSNPVVREEIRRIIGYWLELGVAGFRVDAVPFVLEKPSIDGGKARLQFDWLHDIREFLQWRTGSAALLGEANVMPEEAQKYFAGGDGLHMMFNFWVNQHLFAALATGDAQPLGRALRQTAGIPQGTQWAHFLRNHDELDLGRLPDELRRAVFEAYGAKPSMQLYGRGIRRRLAPMLGDRRRIELAYSLLFSMPGTPVLRYGEEIGMGDSLRLRERLAIRTPMQWSGAPNAGFTTAERPVTPLVTGGPYGYEKVNVEAQLRDPGSLLRWITAMIRLRKECPEIGWGTSKVLPSGRREVLAMLHTWRGTGIVCVHNLAPESVRARVALDAPTAELTALLDHEPSSPGARGVHQLDLEPYAYRWYRLDGQDSALRRRRVG
jgi:maltose alpha-D-glucosyltransferase/alpha-amylase